MARRNQHIGILLRHPHIHLRIGLLHFIKAQPMMPANIEQRLARIGLDIEGGANHIILGVSQAIAMRPQAGRAADAEHQPQADQPPALF